MGCSHLLRCASCRPGAGPDEEMYEESSEDEEAPQAVPLKQGGKFDKRQLGMSLVDDEADEGSDEEEDDDSMEGEWVVGGGRLGL